MHAHLQPNGVKAALSEVLDVGPQLGEVHLLVVPILFEEVLRLFAYAGENPRLEGLECIGLDPAQLANPAVLEYPRCALFIPACPLRMNVSAQFKRFGPEVKDADARERLAARIESSVVEDPVVKPERPLAVRPQVRARRPTLDLVA